MSIQASAAQKLAAPGSGGGLLGEDAAERALRYEKVRAGMAGQGLDAVLAFAPIWRRENLRYLTDASVGGAATFALLTANGDPVAFTTRAEDAAAIRAAGGVGDVRRIRIDDTRELTGALRDLGVTRLGVGHLELLPLAFSAR